MIRASSKDKREDKNQVPEEELPEEVNREIMPMMFGMIPFYHDKGPATSHGLSTNNCRLEGLLQSKLYRRAWQSRQFCVVLCQGFYEWKTSDGIGDAKGVKRQPYLIYMPQKDKQLSCQVPENWENFTWSEDNGWEGPEILKMAGLYDIWKDPESGDEVYSYTIITMESNKTLDWLHHRMPAILDEDDKVEKWLGAKDLKISDKELMELLKPVDKLEWHKVDGKVGNSRCQDGDCMKVLKVDDKPKNTFMDKWLIKKVKKEEKGPEDEEKGEELQPSKRIKTEKD